MSSHALLQKSLIKQCVRTCLLKNDSTQTVLQIWDIGNSILRNKIIIAKNFNYSYLRHLLVNLEPKIKMR